MSARATDHDRAVRFYARLVALYPQAHRDQFGTQMQRTFEDSYRHTTQGERRVGTGFWLALLWDEGRSIVRERAVEPQGDVLFYALVLAWVCGLAIVPVIPAVSDWRNLVLPTTVLAAMLLAVPGTSGIARRVITIAGALAVVECMTAVAQSMKMPNDLLAPVLLVACMAFAIKTLAGLNASIAGIRDSIWSREELTYGALAGFAGVVAVAFGIVNTSDNSPAFPFFFYLVVPFVCAVAGFKSSRRNMSARSGTYAALGSMLIGATIWFLALPLLYEGALLTVYRDHLSQAPTLLPLYWQRPLSLILFWAALNGMVGAFFGTESYRKDDSVPESASQP